MVKRQVTSPLVILLVALALLAPSLMVWSPDVSGDDTDPVWPQFGRNERHTGEGPAVERGLPNRDPVKVWDFGKAEGDDDFVVSWGTVVGNFTNNLDNSSGYERESQHVVYVTATEDDVDGGWRTKLLIRDGETGELMWWVNLRKMKNNNGDLISNNDVLDRRVGMPTPAIADFDGDGRLEIAAGRTEGNISIYDPKIYYNPDSDNYVVGNQIWDDEPDEYNAHFSLARTSPSIMDLTNDGLPDLVFSGLFHNGDSFTGARVVALKGTDATEIFKRQPQGTEISSPAILDLSPRFYSFITVYNGGQMDAWAWDESGSPWSGWSPNSDLGPDVRDPLQSDSSNHPMLPSAVIADLTSDTGQEVLIAVPSPDEAGDAKLYVFQGQDAPDRAQGWDEPVSVEGDIDGTPAVGDIDGDSKLEIVVLSWWDRDSTGDESFRVTAFNGEDSSENWRSDEGSIDTSYAGWTDDDGEHAVASPVLVDFTEDGLLDVVIAVTPEVLGLKGKNPGGEVTNEEFHYALPNRNNDNRMFDSLTVCDLNNDGAVDILVSGSVFTANLTEQTLNRGDIEFLDQTKQPLDNDEADEDDIIDMSIRIHNKGTRDAKNVKIFLRERDRESGTQLPGSPFTKNIAHKSSVTVDVEDWTPSSTGEVPVWVVIEENADTNPEVRYTNNNASRILHVWPAYGVDIEVRDNATQSGPPDSNVTWLLNATNLGRQTDDFSLSFEWNDDEDWSSEAQPPLTDMEGNETRDLTFNVTIPGEAEAGEHHLTIRATSAGNNSRWDEVELTVIVGEVHGLHVEAPVQEATTVPDHSIDFELRVFNDGNLDESFTVKTAVEDAQNKTEWDNEVPGSITVEAGKSKLMVLEIISPGCNQATCDTEWGETYNVTVKITSDNGTGEDIVVNTTIITTMAQARIEPASQGVDPGNTATYTIHLFNLYESEDNQTLNLTLTSGPGSWNPELELSSVTLDRFASTWLDFNVTAPSGGSAGDKATHTVRVQGDETGWEDNLRVRTTVNPLVGLRLTPREDYGRTIRVSNDEEVQLNLRVTNFEPEVLDLTLRLDEPDDRDWVYRFDPKGGAPDDRTWSDSLGEDESQSVDFYITIGDDAEQGERIDILFNVSSDDGRFSKELSFVFVVDPVYDVTLTGPIGVQPLLVNLSQPFQIELTNSGNGQDTFNVSVELDEEDWIEHNINGHYTLDKDETVTLTLRLKPMDNFTVGEVHDITITAISDEEPAAVAQYSFSLEPTSWRLDSSANLSARSDDTVTWTYTVSNPDENSLRFFFEVEDEPVEDWPMNMTFTDGSELEDGETYQGKPLYSVLLRSGESITVDLNIIIPEAETPAENQFHFTLHASGYADESDSLSVTVEQVYNHSLAPRTHGTIRLGGQLTISATLTNLGNGDDTYDLEAETLGAPGWAIVPVEAEVTVAADDSQVVEFTVTASADPAQAQASPASYELRITATSQGAPLDHDNRSVTLDHEVQVEPFFDFELYFTTPTSEQGAVSSDVYFSFQVNNTGNVQDIYDLTAEPSVPQLYPTFANNEESLTIDALDDGASNVRVNVPDTGESWTILLTVTSQGGGSLAKTQVLDLSLVQAALNLIVKRIYIDPEDPKDGDTITITAVLKAVDEAASGVTVQVLLDDKEIERFTIDLDQDEEETREVAKFKGQEGEHTIEVILDPDDEIEEIQKDDNSNDQSFIVAQADDGGNAGIWFILILVVILVGAGYYVYQQRSQLTDEERPDKGGTLLKKSDRFPLIINCPGCAVKIKVNKPGGFRCPACKTIGAVNEKGKLGQEPSKQASKEAKAKDEAATGDDKAKAKAVGAGAGAEAEEGAKADQAEDGAQTVVPTGPVPETQVETPAFNFPAIVGCPGCQTQIQLPQAGSNQCPACKKMLEVSEVGMVAVKPIQPGAEVAPETAPSVEGATDLTPTTPVPVEQTTAAAAAAAAAPGEAAAPEPKKAPEPDAEFPIIIRCQGCQAKVRVREPGKFRCPACKTTAQISPQGQVVDEKAPAEDLDWGEDEATSSPAGAKPQAQAVQPSSVGCPHCQARIKVPKPGKFRCPACKSISKLHPSGTIESITGPAKGKAPKKGAKKSAKKGSKKTPRSKTKPKPASKPSPGPTPEPTPTPQVDEDLDWEDEGDDTGPAPVAGTGSAAATPTPEPVPPPTTQAVPTEPASVFPMELGCPTCGSPIRVPKPCKFRCPSCKEVGLVDGQGHVASEAAIKATAEQARIATAQTPEGALANFQEHLNLTPDEAAQLYNGGLTSLRAVKEASQKQLEKALPAQTPTQVKRLRMDIRFLDLDEIEGPAGHPAAAAQPVGEPEAPASQPDAAVPDTSATSATTASGATPDPGPESDTPFEGGCPACNATIEVAGSGRFQCPHCSAVAEMEADGTVTLLEAAGSQPVSPPTGATLPAAIPSTLGPKCANCQVEVSVPGPGVFRCPSCLSVSELDEKGLVTLKQTADGQFSAACANCQVTVQVAEPGMFRCPSCLSVSELDEKGQVTLKQGPEVGTEVGTESAPSGPTPETPAASEAQTPRSASCGSCGSSVKVPKPGKFRCPKCRSISRLADDGLVTLVKGPDGQVPESPGSSSQPTAAGPAQETPTSADPNSVGCPVCEAQVRVPKPGKFRCPSCRSISRLGSDGKVKLVKGAPKADTPKAETQATKDGAAGDAIADDETEEWDLEDEPAEISEANEATQDEPEGSDRKKSAAVDPEEEAQAREAVRKAVSSGPRIGGF